MTTDMKYLTEHFSMNRAVQFFSWIIVKPSKHQSLLLTMERLLKNLDVVFAVFLVFFLCSAPTNVSLFNSVNIFKYT